MPAWRLTMRTGSAMTGHVRALLGCGFAGTASPALARSATVTPAGGGWSMAHALGMTGALASSEGVSMVMSCGAAGYCTVAGTVTHTGRDVAREAAAFRASETRGTWGRAAKITGL